MKLSIEFREMKINYIENTEQLANMFKNCV